MNAAHSVLAAIGLSLAMMLSFPAHEADAQPQRAPTAAPSRGAKAPAADAPKGFTNPEGKSGSRAAALIFYLFGALTLAGAIFVITRRNMVTAVMGMVGTFIALAGLYVMLYAHFLAAIQVVVYAGAIMVLFVFVIMILNRPEAEPWALQGIFGKGIAGLSLLYLFYRLAEVLWTVKDTKHASEAPIVPGGFEFGSTKAIGKTLFTDYLFPFEAVSIVLLTAVVGAIAIARPKLDDQSDAQAEGEGA